MSVMYLITSRSTNLLIKELEFMTEILIVYFHRSCCWPISLTACFLHKSSDCQLALIFICRRDCPGGNFLIYYDMNKAKT